MKKALMRIWSYALVVLAGGLIITSCAKDRDEDNAEQSYIKLDKSSVDLTQLGETFELAAKPKVIVSSNVYWVIELVNVTNPSEDVEWIDLGGVSAGHGADKELVFTVSENDGDARSAIVRFKAKDGTYADFRINQADKDQRLIIYGENTGEESVTANVDVNSFDGWNPVGRSPRSVRYSGKGVFISADSPSSGEGASAGNNVAFTVAGASFNINNVEVGEATNFKFSFNSVNSEGAYNNDELVVAVSANGVDWENLTYTRSNDSGWANAAVNFTTAGSYEKLYFRFRTTATLYRIDDIILEYGDGTGPELDLPTEIADEGWENDVEGDEYSKFPVAWAFSAANMKPEADGGYNYKATFEGQGYLLAPPEEPAQIMFVQRPSEPGEVRTDVKREVGTSGQPFASQTLAGDYWLFKAPVESIGDNSTVTISFISRSSGGGPKYLLLEYYDYQEHGWLPVGDVHVASEDGITEYSIMHTNTDGIPVVGQFTLAKGFTNKYLWIKYTIVGIWSADGSVKPTGFGGGTHRFQGAAANGDSPKIIVDDPSAIPDVINIDVTGLEDGIVVLPGDGATPVKFTVNVNYKWSITANDWMTITPEEGSSDTDVEVTVIGSANRDPDARRGKITITSNGVTKDIIVVQSPAGGGENSGVIFFDDFSWVADPSAADFDVFTDNGGADGTRIDSWETGLPAVANSNPGWTSEASAIYARPGYLKFARGNVGGDLTSPALDKITGEMDIFVSFKALRYRSDAYGNIVVSIAEGGGTIQGATIFSSGDKWNENRYQTWRTIGLRINGANAQTRIKIASEVPGTGYNRFFMDDFKVIEYTGEGTGGGQVDVEEPMIDFADLKDEVDVDAAGGRITVRMAANVDIDGFTISEPGWITEFVPAPTPGPGRAPVALKTYYFDIAATAQDDTRTGTITFTNVANSLSKVLTVSQAGLVVFEGLPQNWSFNAAGGFVSWTSGDKPVEGSISRIWIDEGYVMGQDAGSTAKMTFVRDDANISDPNITSFVRDISAQNLRVAGGRTNDAWVFEIPVKNAPAGQQIKFDGAIRCSGGGLRNFMLEFSTDGTAWTQVDPISEQVTTTGDNAGTYTIMRTDGILPQDGSANWPFSKTITIPTAVPNGKYYLRLRATSNIRQDLKGIVPTDGGTIRLVDAFQISAQ